MQHTASHLAKSAELVLTPRMSERATTTMGRTDKYNTRSTVQRTATQRNTVQHSATQCNTVQHSASHLTKSAELVLTLRMSERATTPGGPAGPLSSCCVAVCCSVLQRVAVCCSVFQCVAVCCGVWQCALQRVLQFVLQCVLQCVLYCQVPCVMV